MEHLQELMNTRPKRNFTVNQEVDIPVTYDNNIALKINGRWLLHPNTSKLKYDPFK